MRRNVCNSWTSLNMSASARRCSSLPRIPTRESAANTVRFFGDRADYLLLENPARFTSAGFKKTPFANWFSERNTPTLKIPAITQGTIDAWHTLERKEGKYLSFDDARKHPGIHELSRMELDYVRNRFLVQCEDYV